MPKSNLPNSIRKFLRKEKARIRREFLDFQEGEKKIKELVKGLVEIYKRDRHEGNFDTKPSPPHSKS